MPTILDPARRRLDLGGAVDEQGGADVGQGTRHELGRLVIVVAVAGEDAARERAERRQRGGEVRRCLLRLHGEEVAREEDQVGSRATARAQMDRRRVTDMKGPRCGSVIWTMRSGRPPEAPGGAPSRAAPSASGPAGARSTTMLISSRRLVNDCTTPKAASAYGIQKPAGRTPKAAAMAHGNARNVPATKNWAGRLMKTRYARGRIRGWERKKKWTKTAPWSTA